MFATTSSRSLWLAEAGSAPGYAPLRGEVTADVAVIGAGIAGASLALTLQSRGLRVALVEAVTVGSGVTGTTTAKVTALQGAILSQIERHHGRGAVRDYATASLSAVRDTADNVATHGISCDLESRPAVTYTTDPGRLTTLRREFELAADAGLAVHWSNDDAGLGFGVAGAIWLEDQLAVQPVRYVRGLVDAFTRAGGQCFEHSRVTAVHAGRPYRIETAEGTVRAGHVVVCTHFPILDRGLLFARMEAQRSYCVSMAVQPGEALPRAMAMGIGGEDRSVQWFGDELIVGGEGHPAGARPSTAGPERFDALERWGSSRWRTRSATARWSAQDPVPYDRLPMIGPLLPGADRLWVATGWAKWGLTGATFAARVLADQIEGRPDEWRGRFRPNRLSLRGTPTVAKLGAGFQSHMVLDRLEPAQTRDAATVAPGQARVLRHGRAKVGVYRDGDGTAHAVSMRCTHLGCLLRFNAAEVSWDCPCHGSRFGVDGEVLEGPAVRDLKRYQIEP